MARTPNHYAVVQVVVQGHEPEPQTLYAVRHDSGNGLYKWIMKHQWKLRCDPGKAEPGENLCGDVLENYLAVANMALRFPQAVKPLGEPLALLDVQTRTSNEIAGIEMAQLGPAPTHGVESCDSIPDWGDSGAEDACPAVQRHKQGSGSQK